ncbi:MAG: endolytic transglycosylase MltG [bacterium]
MKKILVVFLVVFIATAVYFSVRYYEYRKFKEKKAVIEDPVTVNVSPGNSWGKISRKLKKKGVVTSAELFRFLIREKKLDNKLQTGEFEFSEPVSPVEVAEIISSGKVKLYSFTIPEGYNKYDAAEVFKQKEWINENHLFLNYCNDRSFLKNLGMTHDGSCEGFLFPSTYKFPRGVNIKTVITKMYRDMKKTLNSFSEEIKKSDFNEYRLLTMASIIEKETGAEEERARIASVFLNRIDRGMKLQTDPTVIYGMLPEFQGDLKSRHLLKDHEYNTYTRKGFPAGPICFPGKNSIKAVLYPEETDYLYFVSTRKGFHYFSKNLREHNAAVEHYLIKNRKTPFIWKGR